MKKSLLLILSNCFVFGLLAQPTVTITNATQTTSGFEYDFGQSLFSSTASKSFTVNGLLSGESITYSLLEDITTSGTNVCGVEQDPSSFSVDFGKNNSFNVFFVPGSKTYQKRIAIIQPGCIPKPPNGCPTTLQCVSVTEPNTGQKSATLTITITGGGGQDKRASAGVYTMLLKGNSVTNITSVEDVIQTTGTFYPNPATDRISCEGAFEIYDLNGQLLLAGYNEANISELSKGLYILKKNNKSTKLVKE